MITYVNTVLVSNLNETAANMIVADRAPAAAASMSAASTDAGKFIFMNCDPNVASDDLYNVNKSASGTAGSAADISTIKIGIVTKKNTAVHLPNGTTEYRPIIKWSNEIKAADIKSYNNLTYAGFNGGNGDTEDVVTIDFTNLASGELNLFDDGGKRIIVRLTFKDMPHRYRKWTESYEYITEVGDTKATIAYNIANLINKEWKRARVSAIVGTLAGTTFTPDANWGTSTPTTGTVVKIEALPYDDDDNVDSLNWANKVRFNANIYYTDPAADGWEAINKKFPTGVTIAKVPGKQYPASAKLVRDRESQAMGYQGILNRGEGTWPIIKPDMETDLTAHYDAITLEFENMYRAADDIFRKTKQTVEIYGTATKLTEVKAILDRFVG